MTLSLEKQCCSLDLAKRLKELGVKQESLFVWNEISDRVEVLNFASINAHGLYSAFTLAELGGMLHRGRLTTEWGLDCICRVVSGEDVFEAETEADARAQLLVYLIENDLLKADQINQSSAA
jgi:hypothetical protein